MNKKTYGERIVEIGLNQVFVFGSNMDGFHGAGAAGWASFGKMGNVWREEHYDSKPSGWKGKLNVKGVAKGFQEGTNGKSYALPTVKHAGWRKSLTMDEITNNIKELYKFAKIHSEWEFLVTGSETGNIPLNGYSHKQMVEMYVKAGEIPENIIFSDSYQKIIYFILIQQLCKHTNATCVYDSADGEFERWQCNDCGKRWGVEIAQ